MDWRVRQVIDTMTREITEPLALARLAAGVNLSTSRLAHLFRDETGCSPGRYLRDLRLERARTLLEETTLSVKEIMASVGINDPSHFSRDFARRYGVPPRRVRARARSPGLIRAVVGWPRTGSRPSGAAPVEQHKSPTNSRNRQDMRGTPWAPGA
jgi:AraC family transcriptional regulator of arabinose operon